MEKSISKLKLFFIKYFDPNGILQSSFYVLSTNRSKM